MAKTLRVTWVKSWIGSSRKQRATIKALGLTKLNSSVILPDNQAVRGMVNKVSHLVEVEPVAEEAGPVAG